MGWGITLTTEQWDELDRVRLTTASAKVFRNCLIIMKSSLGETIASMAQELGCGTDTVIRARRRYRHGGVGALSPIKPSGRPPRATGAFVEEMKRAVETQPQALGYGFSTWSSARLAEHLAKVTDVRFSDDQLRRLLHAHGYSFHRPKHTLKGKRDEAAYRKAQAELAELKKTPWRKTPPRRSSFRTRWKSIAIRP
jgi:transposase